MEHVSISQNMITFYLFHGDMEDYHRELIVPLERFLEEGVAKKIFLDFGRLTFVSKREAEKILLLVKTLRLLNLEHCFKNVQPSVSLAFARWIPQVKEQMGVK